jgi:hypothetical protein
LRNWKALWQRFRAPVIDALSIGLATFTATLIVGHQPGNAALSAVVAALAVVIKTLNPRDTSYGVGAWRERPLPTTMPEVPKP